MESVCVCVWRQSGTSSPPANYCFLWVYFHNLVKGNLSPLCVCLPAICSCRPVFLLAGGMLEEMGNVFQMAGHMAPFSCSVKMIWLHYRYTDTQASAKTLKHVHNIQYFYTADRALYGPQTQPEWHYVLYMLAQYLIFQSISGPICLKEFYTIFFLKWFYMAQCYDLGELFSGSISFKPRLFWE